MTLISFEGVDVEVPSVEGLRFYFEDGMLAVECTNYSGKFFLSKQPSKSTLPSTSLPSATDVFTTPEAPKFAESKKRPFVEVTPVVEVYEEAKHNKVDNISPDEKQPNLAKAIQFLESEKENIYASEDELELLLTQREATLPAATDKSHPTKKHKGQTKRPALNQLEEVATNSIKSKALSKSKATTKARKKPVKKHQVVQASKINFFVPIVAENAEPETIGTIIHEIASDEDIVHTSPELPNNTAAHEPFRSGSIITIDVKGQVPSQRWGCTATLVSNQRIVVYGGEGEDESTLSDMFLYDIEKKEWSRPLNCESIPRTWHDSVYLDQKNLLLVFGGEKVVDGGQETLSDLMVLDTECFLWYPPAVSGTPPMARSGHTCVALGKDVVVFGGTRGRTRLSTVHLLDTETWNWSNLKINGKAPTARTYHSAVAMDSNRMVIFGGNDSKKSYDTVHVLERQLDDTWSWFNPCVVGQGPNARTGQIAIAMNQRSIVVHGGWDPQNADKVALYGDAFTLDTETWEWSSISLGAETDSLRRVGHVAIKSSDNTMLLFGGQDASECRLNSMIQVELH